MPTAGSLRSARGQTGAPRGITPSHRAATLDCALARCYGTFHKGVAHKVAEYDMTTAQFGVLEALYHLGPLTLGDLAEKLLVTGGNVTYVMDRLQKDGLVTRRRCSNDRRVVWASLTDEGRDLIEEVFPGHVDHVSRDGRCTVSRRAGRPYRALLKKLGQGDRRRSPSWHGAGGSRGRVPLRVEP